MAKDGRKHRRSIRIDMAEISEAEVRHRFYGFGSGTCTQNTFLCLAPFFFGFCSSYNTEAALARYTRVLIYLRFRLVAPH